MKRAAAGPELHPGKDIPCGGYKLPLRSCYQNGYIDGIKGRPRNNIYKPKTAGSNCYDRGWRDGRDEREAWQGTGVEL